MLSEESLRHADAALQVLKEATLAYECEVIENQKERIYNFYKEGGKPVRKGSRLDRKIRRIVRWRHIVSADIKIGALYYGGSSSREAINHNENDIRRHYAVLNRGPIKPGSALDARIQEAYWRAHTFAARDIMMRMNRVTSVCSVTTPVTNAIKQIFGHFDDMYETIVRGSFMGRQLAATVENLCKNSGFNDFQRDKVAMVLDSLFDEAERKQRDVALLDRTYELKARRKPASAPGRPVPQKTLLVPSYSL